MTHTNKHKQVLFFMIALFSIGLSIAQTKKASVTVNKVEDAPIISKHIYGHFAEHLGKCIYGGIYVGDTSVIPNKNGVRKDIIAALKDLKIPNLRWPGGCFADTYHWKDGIGPKQDRPTIVNTWWGGTTEDNSFGTHNFLDLCEELETEPYLAGNVGSGTVQELADWLQYVNHNGVSPMADLRRKNGREKPWRVKYWGVGNEAWGCGGNMTAEYYANEYRKYATFMSSWDNDSKIFRIASGASGGDLHWTEVLMRDIPKSLIEGIALHSYSVTNWDKKGSDKSYDEAQYFGTMREALKMDEFVTNHIAIMDKYDPKKQIALVVDEWGGWYDADVDNGQLYQQNTMRDAMIAGVTLNIFNNHSERVRMANLAQAVNVLQAVILTEGEKMILTPTYYVMKMYNVHQDAKLLPVQLISPDYEFNGEKLPAVSVSASEKDGVTHISLVNIDSAKRVEVTLNVEALNIKNFNAQILTSSKLQDYNSFENPDKIAPTSFKDFKLKNGSLTVTLPPFSVVVLEGK